jgi:hypothetical protein
MYCRPSVPQECEHALAAPQASNSQSTGQWCTLQSRVSSSGGQRNPYALLNWVTERERVQVPVPQDFEQVPKVVQLLTSQCTAHSRSLHSSVLVRSGHVSPPNSGTILTTRDFDLVP